MPTPEKPRSILTPAQREEWATELAAGVPEPVILEFIERLDRYMERWEDDLRKQVRAGQTPAIPRGDDA
jgi:hypothetical protein